jgi:phi LC3 family holin
MDKGDIMKINIQARFKNKIFLISMSVLLVSIIYKVLSLFGIAPSIDENAILEVVSMVVDFLALLGVVVDPTTKGINDSERALTYFTENDIRDKENIDKESEGVV